MSRLRKRGEDIRHYILENVEKYPQEITQRTAKKFNISRQAVNKHIQLLVGQQVLQLSGTTRNRRYDLAPTEENDFQYKLKNNLQEDVVWRNDIHPLFVGFPDNVMDIWNYSFNEMFNNAIDHSAGNLIYVQVKKTAITTQIYIYDDGEGIFKKIQRELGLLDESHAVLELSKGKLTTDPQKHTGEGIFFTSRMLDDYVILSGKTFFSHEYKEDVDWILERKKFQSGTSVFMTLKNNTSRTVKKVFDKYSSIDDIGFTKTIIPVRLAQYGDELLVSRSQAKRLLARLDRFKTVIFDFEGVASIGQAFADEIFRVFPLHNKEVRIEHSNANKNVERMILHAILNI